MALMYSVRNFEYTYGYTKAGQIYYEEYFPDAHWIVRNLRHHYVYIYRNFTCDPQTVTLTYPDEECGFSMEIDLKGGWVYEKSR